MLDVIKFYAYQIQQLMQIWVREGRQKKPTPKQTSTCADRREIRLIWIIVV